MNIDLGKAKIGKLKTDTPLTYSGRVGDKIKLKSGSAEINGKPMEIGKEYILKDGDDVLITSASEMEQGRTTQITPLPEPPTK